MCVCVGGGEGGDQCRHARGNKDKVGAGCPEGGLLATGHMVFSGPGGPGNLSPPEPHQSTFIKHFGNNLCFLVGHGGHTCADGLRGVLSCWEWSGGREG